MSESVEHPFTPEGIAPDFRLYVEPWQRSYKTYDGIKPDPALGHIVPSVLNREGIPREKRNEIVNNMLIDESNTIWEQKLLDDVVLHNAEIFRDDEAYPKIDEAFVINLREKISSDYNKSREAFYEGVAIARKSGLVLLNEATCENIVLLDHDGFLTHISGENVSELYLHENNADPRLSGRHKTESDVPFDIIAEKINTWLHNDEVSNDVFNIGKGRRSQSAIEPVGYFERSSGPDVMDVRSRDAQLLINIYRDEDRDLVVDKFREYQRERDASKRKAEMTGFKQSFFEKAPAQESASTGLFGRKRGAQAQPAQEEPKKESFKEYLVRQAENKETLNGALRGNNMERVDWVRAAKTVEIIEEYPNLEAMKGLKDEIGTMPRTTSEEEFFSDAFMMKAKRVYAAQLKVRNIIGEMEFRDELAYGNRPIQPFDFYKG